jgi:assimilatory nitrate reductase catalytic subunit
MGCRIGKLPDRQAADPGAVVRACFGVARNTIESAILAGAGMRATGKRLKVGATCGSCELELNRMLAANTAEA